MKRNLFFTEFRNSLYRALKFGIVGSLIGLILHAIWDNLDTVLYTMITGFLTGFFIGFFELLFSHPKAGRLPYLAVLFSRTIIYFMITLFCVYLPFRIYLGNAGYSREVLKDPQIYADIEKVYYLAKMKKSIFLVHNYRLIKEKETYCV